MSKIPLAVPDISEEESAAVHEVLRSGWLTQGPKTLEFEEALKTYLGAKHVFCVSSCTTGLFLALKALGLGPGDEVIVPSYSFIATANSVVHTGATPVFADVSVDDINLDLRSVEQCLTAKTKAVMLVHQAGFPADVPKFKAFCEKRNLFLIEDAACAIGSRLNGRPIGCHSDMVVFSFHPRKVLTTGEGGAIAYNGSNPKVIEFLNISRKHGMSTNDLDRHLAQKVVIETYPISGYNFRLTDMQSAIGLVQLKKLDQIIENRRRVVSWYREGLGKHADSLFLEKSGTYANYQTLLYKIKPEDERGNLQLMEHLMSDGIATRRGIMASHLEPCYQGRKHGPLPQTESWAKLSVVLPLFAQMTEAQTARVCDRIRSFYL